MPQYKVLQKSYINNRIVEEGEIVEYDGKPGTNLELIKQKRGVKPDNAQQVPEADQNTES